MSTTWLFITENGSESSPWVDILHKHDWTVLKRTHAEDVEPLIQSGIVSGILFEGILNSEIFNFVLEISNKYPHYPLVFSSDLDSKIKNQIEENELILVLNSKEPSKRIGQLLSNLISISQLNRKVTELSQYSKESIKTNPLKMFDHLEINHIIDKVLLHFGPLVPSENLHWITVNELERLITLDEESFKLELQHRFTTSPHLRSFKDSDLTLVHTKLKSLAWGSEQINDSKSLIVWRHQGRIQSLVLVKNQTNNTPLGYFYLEESNTTELDYTVKLMEETLSFILPVWILGMKCWEAESQSFIDILTPLYNQKFLNQVVDNEVGRCQRSGGQFSVLFLDIDYFKQVNDSKGHWIGSRLISELGKILHTSIRSCDFGFRYGGDEFVIVLVGTGQDGAKVVAERIRKTVEENKFNIEGHEINLTLSIGLASYPIHAKSGEEIIKLADEAMYNGKNTSRNIVYIAS